MRPFVVRGGRPSGGPLDRALLLLLAFIACANPPAVEEPAPAARRLAEETTITLTSGATLVAPKGWSITQSADVVVLADPDKAATLIVIEREEVDGLAAITAAWKHVRPGFALAVAGEPDTPPPTHGWDAIVSVDYAAPDRHATSAIARRWGNKTWVVLVDGEAAAIERRSAQIETTRDSLRPKGMKPESFAAEPALPMDGARAKELDAFIDDAFTRLEVPGAAVAVLQGGKLAYERTLGVREIGKSERVSAQTLFLIGSITKSMTTFMEAALVDAKVLAWDTPVTKLLPSFALGDADITQKVALWHMSCACTGMPRRDTEHLFEYADVSPEARIASMRTMTPTTGFGETFQYSNLMVAAGGFAASHAFAPDRPLGEAYAAAMRDKVFVPIGMHATTLDFDVVARADHAQPHAVAIDGETRALPIGMEKNVLSIAPAGAVWTNLSDFERYALTELARGVTPEGKRVVSEENLAERGKVRVRSGAEDGYGLGLDVSTFAGLVSVGHDGGAFGYGTTMFILPERDVAILVLTNVRNGGGHAQLPFNRAVVRKVVELLFAGAKDVAAPSVKYYVDARRRATARALAGVDRAPDPRWLALLGGTYTNESLGKVVVSGATFDAGEWKSTFGRRLERSAEGGRREPTEGALSSIVLLDPPFAGAAIAVVPGDPPKLLIEDGQAKFVLSR